MRPRHGTTLHMNGHTSDGKGNVGDRQRIEIDKAAIRRGHHIRRIPVVRLRRLVIGAERTYPRMLRECSCPCGNDGRAGGSCCACRGVRPCACRREVLLPLSRRWGGRWYWSDRRCGGGYWRRGVRPRRKECSRWGGCARRGKIHLLPSEYRRFSGCECGCRLSPCTPREHNDSDYGNEPPPPHPMLLRIAQHGLWASRLRCLMCRVNIPDVNNSIFVAVSERTERQRIISLQDTNLLGQFVDGHRAVAVAVATAGWPR